MQLLRPQPRSAISIAPRREKTRIPPPPSINLDVATDAELQERLRVAGAQMRRAIVGVQKAPHDPGVPPLPS